MNAVPFDTLKLARDFQEAGLTPPVAVGTAAALADALVGADLATKSNLAAFVTKLDLAQVETRIMTAVHAVDAKVELLRREMTIRLGSMMILGVGVILAALRFMPHP